MDEFYKKAIRDAGAIQEMQKLQDARSTSLESLAGKYGSHALEAAMAQLDGSAALRAAAALPSRALEEIVRVQSVSQIYALKRELDASLGRFSEASAITDSLAYQAATIDAATALERLGQQYHPTDLAATLAANHLDYARALSAHSAHQAIEAASAKLNHQWAGKVGAFGYAYGNLRAPELALEAHYLSVSSTALLAQEYAARISLDSVGAATSLPAHEFVDLSSRFVGLTDAYGRLLHSYNDEEHFIASLAPVASDGPPSEVLENVILVDVLSSSAPEDDLVESVEIHRKERKWEAPTGDMLRALNPAFERAFVGAVEALHSSNPDRARHVIVSLRELVTHVLHQLAPDSAVKAWIVDPTHLHEGRPTRAARLYFICRAINNDSFAEFVKADVRSAIACIDLFQKGTHSIEPVFTQVQLVAIVTRTESLLRFLITTARTAA